jgi:hypothetical protein
VLCPSKVSRLSHCQAQEFVGLFMSIHLTIGVSAFPSKYSADLQRVDVYTRVCVEEALKLSVPVALRVIVKPVRKRSNSGPNFALVDAAVPHLQKDAGVDSIVERSVVLIRNSCAIISPLPSQRSITDLTWIDHDDVMLVLGVEATHKIPHLIKREILPQYESRRCG